MLELKNFIARNKKTLLVLLAVVAVIVIVTNSNDNQKEKRAIATACAEVKSQILQSYGVTPTVKGSVLYDNGSDYIVIVKYTTRLGDSGSIGCYVHGNKQQFIYSTLKRMSYNYSYDVEELKTLWKIE